MNINVLPGIRKSQKLPGVLGLYVKSQDSSFAINLTPGIFDQIKHNSDNEIPEYDRQLIFFSVNPMNLGGTEGLATFLKQQPDNFKFTISAPDALCGWLHAYIRETDYRSDVLKKLKIKPFSTSQSSTIQFSSRYAINHIQSLDGFSDYIIKIKFASPNISLCYCEIRNLDAPFPKELDNTDILICNMSRYPNICSSTINHDILITKMKDSLSGSGVKCVLFPSEEGIAQMVPAENPDFLHVEKSDTYDIDLKHAQVTVSHENRLLNYRNSIFPLLIEDDNQQTGLLLGLDYGAAYHLRMQKNNLLNFSSILLPGSSFRNLFALLDVVDQLKNKTVDLYCGKYMAAAFQKFKPLFLKTFSRDVRHNMLTFSGEQGKSTHHTIDDLFDLLLIPYPKDPDYYIIRLTDKATGEVLVFTDSMISKPFLEKNLSGIHTAVFALNSREKAALAETRAYFDDIQEKLQIGKVFILYPGGTLISDLDM